MANESVLNPLEPGFPPATLPTVFVDGVVNLAPAAGTVRFYLQRFDPELTGDAAYKIQVVAQVVMSHESFIATAFFFREQIDAMLGTGIITQSMVDNVLASRKEHG